MIVRDGPDAALPDDHEIFLKGARDGPIGNNPLDIGGRANPDTIVVHAGRTARFRLMNLTAVHPNVAVVLTARPDSAFVTARDTMIVRWIPVAKDGADLPSAARVSQPALQTISMGETYDFEFVPERRGQVLRLEVRTAGGRAGGILLARVPVKVQ